MPLPPLIVKLATEENITKIRRRNEHRKSLLIDNDYLSSEEKSEGVKTPVANPNKDDEKDQTEPDSYEESIPLRPVTSASATTYSTTQIHRILLEIDQTRRHRLNKKDDSVYVLRFRDARFKGDTSTIFDSQRFKESDGFGIYVLFWLGTAFLLLNNIVKYYVNGNTEYPVVPVWSWPIVKLLRKDLVKVGLTDLVMYLSTYTSFWIQRLVHLKVITWNGTGWWFQSFYTTFFFVGWMLWAGPYGMDFPWIAKVFLVLHSLVFVMKMHLYGFYNGYLWKIYRELQFSESLLQKLNDPEKAAHYKDPESMQSILKELTQFCRFELEYQLKVNTAEDEVGVHFPHNLNLYNFFEYSMFPTVVYSLNFPRTKEIRWKFVFEKVAGTFGIIFLMISVAQGWLYPLVMKGLVARDLPVVERAQNYSLILLDIIPPFLMIYLLTFFLIWDVILNAIAELSKYAERDYYGAWWSCTDWSEFSRIWNIPVHKFLLRHVYHSLISAFNLNKLQASLVTFILLSVVHELVMYVVFGKLRGYLLLLQMSQLPLTMISRTKYLKDKKALGNVICWFGFILGPSMICTLYVVW